MKIWNFILKAIKQAKLDGVQIHRKISEFEFKTLKESGVFVWQVLSVGDRLELEENIYADLILFDTKGKISWRQWGKF